MASVGSIQFVASTSKCLPTVTNFWSNACISNGHDYGHEGWASQAQYLAQQFPFIEGEGALVDTLTPTETKVVPQINFAPTDLKKIGDVPTID